MIGTEPGTSCNLVAISCPFCAFMRVYDDKADPGRETKNPGITQ